MSESECAFCSYSIEGCGAVDGIKRMLEPLIGSVLQSIDITLAILLLTGQISIRSVIIVTGGEFRLSLSGPIFGSENIAGRRSPGAPYVLDTVNAITALLLILGEIQALGVFVQARRFNIQVTGPPFGAPRTTGYVPGTERFFADCRKLILNKYMGQERVGGRD
jgi:hypothetical protein